MNKVTLLFTLTLMYMCTLSGMKQSSYTLHPELKKQVIDLALRSSNTLDETIDTIKKFCMLHNVRFSELFNNLKSFTKLAHTLADRFNVSTDEVANTFGTSTAKNYSLFGQSLIQYIEHCSKSSDAINIMQFIKYIGVDVNFSINDQDNKKKTPLNVAINAHQTDCIRVLLFFGATSTEKDINDLEKVRSVCEFPKKIELSIKKRKK